MAVGNQVDVTQELPLQDLKRAAFAEIDMSREMKELRKRANASALILFNSTATTPY